MSDVFAFGVILPEIVSGEKNIAFFECDHWLNLLGKVSLESTVRRKAQGIHGPDTGHFLLEKLGGTACSVGPFMRARKANASTHDVECGLYAQQRDNPSASSERTGILDPRDGFGIELKKAQTFFCNTNLSSLDSFLSQGVIKDEQTRRLDLQVVPTPELPEERVVPKVWRAEDGRERR
ncbi:hypothetical protein NL676_034038 [Syzygium grande]|nr:hypothetical protein NL676_034038 [Syzygium grande]